MAYTPSSLTEQAIHCRAVEALIWGMPVVNFDLMVQAAGRIKAAPNQIVYWSHLPDWKNPTLTLNPDAVYLLPLFDTKDVGRWCSKFRRPATMARSRVRLMIAGRQPSKMSARLALTKGMSDFAADGYARLSRRETIERCGVVPGGGDTGVFRFPSSRRNHIRCWHRGLSHRSGGSNVVNDDMLGSMEFACGVSGAKVVLVLGHTVCGAVKGAIDDVVLGNVTGLLTRIKPAIPATKVEGGKSSKNEA